MSGVNLRQIREAVERRQCLAVHQLREKTTTSRQVWENAALWRMQGLELDEIASYLKAYGYSALDELQWNKVSHNSGKPSLEVMLSEHEEHAGHTWYLICCTLWLGDRCITSLSDDTPSRLCWKAPRRLAQIREDLHDVVRKAGAWYEEFFASSPFALPFAPKGTTGRLRAWLQALAFVINNRIAQPHVAAHTLQFLLAPSPVQTLGIHRSVERTDSDTKRSGRRASSETSSRCDFVDESSSVQASASSRELAPASIGNDHALQEKRLAVDGIAYTKKEFLEYLGPAQGERQWQLASKELEEYEDEDEHERDHSEIFDVALTAQKQEVCVEPVCESFDIYSVHGDDAERVDGDHEDLTGEDFCWADHLLTGPTDIASSSREVFQADDLPRQHAFLEKSSQRCEGDAKDGDDPGNFDDVPAYVLSLPAHASQSMSEPVADDTDEESDSAETAEDCKKELCDAGDSALGEVHDRSIEDTPTATNQENAVVLASDADDWI